MTIQTAPAGVPEWDLADRLRKSLRVADVEVQEMAAYLGASRTTVGNYINGRTVPPRGSLVAWALRCGVDLAWLETGETTKNPPSGGGPDGGSQMLPRLDSNQQPAG